MRYGWLLYNDTYFCQTLPDLAYPVVLLQGSEGGRNRLKESLRSDLHRVLNAPNIRQ